MNISWVQIEDLNSSDKELPSLSHDISIPDYVSRCPDSDTWKMLWIWSIRKILQHINNAANQRWGSRDVAAAASWAVVQRQQTRAWTEHQWRSVEHAAVQQHACKEAHRKVLLPVASKGAGGQHLATNQVPWIVFLHNFLTKDKIIFS